MTFRKIIAAVIFIAAAFLFGTRISNLYNDGSSAPTRAEGFYLDAYVSVTSYANEKSLTADYILGLIPSIDDAFRAAYEFKANDLDDEILSRCLIAAAELNAEYGDYVNLTCGELTALWGISTANPALPLDEEIYAALQSIEDTSYHGGDFSKFGGDTRLDFGSAAKGYACDLIKEQLDNLDNNSVPGANIISMDSSALLYGSKPDGSKFKTAVKDPDNPDEYLGFIRTDAAFISTAGGYERFFEFDGVRYEHIFDLNTGYPAQTDLASVTVVVPVNIQNGGILSDFLSTVIYMRGTENLREYMSGDIFGIAAVDVNGNIYVSEGLDFEERNG